MGSFMESAPLSPSFFLDLPRMPNSNGEGLSSLPDELVLPYISRILMEEDMDGKLVWQFADHPALLQAQEPFAQILSDPSYSDTTFLVDEAANSLSGDGGNMDSNRTGSAAFLQAGGEEMSTILVGEDGDVGIHRSAFFDGAEEAEGFLLPSGNADQSIVQTVENSLSSTGTDAVEARSLFLKGMEEASKFLPKGDKLLGGSDLVRGCKNRNDGSKLEVEAGRASKVMMTKEEEDGASEMYHEIMLNGYKVCMEEMNELRIAMEKKSTMMKGAQGRTEVVDLRTLLTQCAQAVAADNRHGVATLLERIRQYASPTGDAIQRLAFYFADGLEARLAGTGRQFLMANRTSVVEFLKAYQLLMAACPFQRVAFSFSSMAILNAMIGRSRLHIVDYGASHGFQWPGMLYWLSKREGGPPEVKITVVDVPQPGFRPAERIEEIGRQLKICAREFDLPFYFHAVTAKWETVRVEDLNVEPGEVLVVNDLFKFGRLVDESVVVADGASPRDVVLSNIRKMRPDVFIQSIVNSSSGPFFLTRFREALFFFSALFDMLDATMPRESHQRLVLEQDIIRGCALNAIAREGVERAEHPETYRRWQARNQRAGLRQLPLKPEVVKTARDKVKNHHHKDFVVDEDGQWLLQGWKGRILFAHSTWVAQE